MSYLDPSTDRPRDVSADVLFAMLYVLLFGVVMPAFAEMAHALATTVR